MKKVYNGVETTILSTPAEWTAAVGTAGGPSIDGVRARLQALETTPTIASFLQLDMALKQLLSKPGAPAAANTLNAQVTALKNTIRDRDTLMQRIEKLLRDEIAWPTKCLCAELYTNTADPWGTDRAIAGDLEMECRMTSGWAMNAPTDFDGFCEKGEADANCVKQWPNLTKKAQIQFGSRQKAWPPAWTKAWRKGLYCHSSAAIAAWMLHTKRTELATGLGVQIKSIDIVQQMPGTSGTMSHWWVFVNRPDSLRLSTGTKPTATAAQWNVFELVGGFVVDIWGALWLDQLGHATEWASNEKASEQKAVQDGPFIQIENMAQEAARVHIRHVYP
jgi:hypothetical protein